MAKKPKAAGDRVGVDRPVDPPVAEVYRISVDLRKIVHRPDYTESGDTPVKPPRLLGGGEGYLPALRELVDSIVERYGGADKFERFVSSHLDGLPADASTAVMLEQGLQNLQNAILANDVFAAISATVYTERALAARWTGYRLSTGYKSAQARKENGAPTQQALHEKMQCEVERLQQESPRLSRTAAIDRAGKKLGCSRATFYRLKKEFGDR